MARKPESKAGKRESSAFSKALHRLVESKDKIRYGGLDALSGAHARDVAVFGTEWGQIAAERRREIATAMLEAAEEYLHADYADLFRVMLDDGDEVVRASAVSGLATDDSPTFGKRLLRLVAEDQSSLVRAAAATGLGNFLYDAETEDISVPTGEVITGALLARFNDTDEDLDVRRRALEAAAYSNEARVTQAIQAAYDDGERELRASAVFAMGRNADKAWIPTVVRELRSEDAALRYEAATAAGELTASEAMPLLVKMVDDSDSQVRESVVWALGQIGGNEARRILERIIEDGPESLSEAAEEALAEVEMIDDLETFNMFDFEAASLEDLEAAEGDDEPDTARPPRAN